MGLGVAVLLGQTKADNVDLPRFPVNTHEEVVGLDVAKNEVARVVAEPPGVRRTNLVLVETYGERDGD